METKRILIVDDDADYVLAVRMILEGAGYLVEDAPNGKAGLEKMRELHPNIVLMDVMMTSPLDGYYATQFVMDDPELSQIPILMVSSIASTEYASSFPTDQYLNIVDFVDKPPEPQQLLAKIATWIR
jgi:CheY-like chemotaxis protein